MIEKKIVEKNFSRSVKTYEKYAIVQKYMAEKLIKFNNDNPKDILEIGSGTGLFTELLIEKYSRSTIDILDISSDMINESEKKFGKKINNYIVADAEHYNSTKKYDLIISNASFQWFKDINVSIKELLKLLKPNGEIIFSIFAQDTYKELKNTFKLLDPNYVFSQNFISKDDFNLEEFNVKILEDEKIFQEFDSLYEFLKAIKGVGANSALKNKKILTKSLLNKAGEIYLEKYKKIQVTNHLLYVSIKFK